jgi:hypothetical protein
MTSIYSIRERISAFPCAISWLLATALFGGQVPANSQTISPKIHVHAAVTDWEELNRKVGTLNAPCGGYNRYLDHPTTVEDFVRGKVKSIQIVRFAPGRSSPTHKDLRNTVRNVWQGKFRSVSCQIDWDEGAIWSIEAVVEFEDGKRSELITDGTHVALQGHDGKSWFLRLLPAAQ